MVFDVMVLRFAVQVSAMNIIIRKVLWLLLLQDYMLAEEEGCQGNSSCSQRFDLVHTVLTALQKSPQFKNNIAPAPANAHWSL